MLRAAKSPPVLLIFSDGTEVVSELARSVTPVRVSASAPITWTGAALSSALTPTVRVPVTMTSATSPALDAAKAGAASAAASATMLAPVSSFFMS
jgi:hypothetical protein